VPVLADASLADVLDAVLRGTKEPVKYSIMDDGVIFARRDVAETNPLYSRHFRVETTDFMAAMRKASGTKTNNISAMARDFFKTLDVDLDVPGKSVFFNDGKGELFVRGTATDLDTIENALKRFRRPQIHIKARFVEVPMKSFVDPATLTNNPVGGMTGILTSDNLKTIMKSLEAKPGTVTLAEPEVVTTSGRQTQMRATLTQTIVTNFVFQETTTNSFILPQTGTIETGPVLDEVATVLPDGYTIDLKTTASLTEFLGYDNTTNTTAVYNSKGEEIDLPQVLPKFRQHQASAHLQLYDNQTVLLGKLERHSTIGGVPPGGVMIGTKPDVIEKNLLVFVTVTIVDPAGNRVHADADLPFAKDGVPPQP
jgi:Flp pilus assembly secretin CpaC